MNNCKTCKWWANHELQNAYTDYFDDLRMCGVQNEKLEITCISEGITGEMWTRADFGCVLHESEARNE